MREIKIRYNLRRNDIPKIKAKTEFFYINLDSLERFPIDKEWDILSRDLFTGLKDKNGTDIYEGDVLLKGKQNTVVTFSEGCFFLGSDPLVLSSGHREIIGDIHSNPELIK